MDGLIQDVRLALRSFGKAPLFTAGAILTLTLTIGAIFGVFVAMWASESLVAFILATYSVPPSFDVHPDLRVMAFTISLATLVGLLFSVAPAWRVGRASVAAALQSSTRAATRSGRTGRTLVAVRGAVAGAADQRGASRT
jgi:hypothetical protein